MNSRKKILLVDDDVDVCEAVGDLLSNRFEVRKANDLRTARACLATSLPDLVIVDVALQEESGLDLCGALRSDLKTKHIKVMVLSGSQDPGQILTAFENGADDYVPKSALPTELLARVQARLRRIEEEAAQKRALSGRTQPLECGNLFMDLDRMQVQVNGVPIPFSALEFNLLKFFVINRDRLVDRTEILAGVWEGRIVSDRTIDTHMVYLRKKLRNFDHAFTTIYGAGYILRPMKIQ